MNNLNEPLVGGVPRRRAFEPTGRTADVTEVRRANLNAYQCFAAFSKSHRIHQRANKWQIKCRRRNLVEEALYYSAAAQGSAYLAAVNQTLIVSDYDRAICRDVALRIENGDEVTNIVPRIKLGIATVSDNVKNAQKELRDIRRGVFELQRGGQIPAHDAHLGVEAEASHTSYADLEKFASSDLLGFTGYFLDAVLSAITVFLSWWEERVIWLLAMSMKVGHGALEEHGGGGILLRSLAKLWREAEKGYTAYAEQTKVEQDYLKALMKG